MPKNRKKQKFKKENRSYKKEWEDDYAFTFSV